MATATRKRKRKPERNFGAAGPPKILSRLRYASDAGFEVSADAVAFGKTMLAYLERYYPRKPAPTVGEICDVLLTLGWSHEERDFKANVDAFDVAMTRYRKRKPFPTWSEVLEVAASLGWHRPTSADPATPTVAATADPATPTVAATAESATPTVATAASA